MIRISDAEKQKVTQVIHEWMDAYEKRDLEKFKKIFSPSETHISWGTGKDECYKGISGFLSQVQRDFTQSDTAKLKLLSLYITTHEKSAWATAEIEPTITIHGEAHCLPPLRGTFVFAKENGDWLIEHTHASWPYPEQKVGDSFPSV